MSPEGKSAAGLHVVLEALRNGTLDELIDQSVKLVGKPTALMSKEDKVRAIQFLNDSGH